MAKTPPPSVTHSSGISRTLFVGDVHGCGDELQKLLELTNPTRVILVGDMFTKGNKPEKVWKLIKKWDMEAVMGNHEVKMLRDHRKSHFTKWSEEMIDWIEALPLWIEEQDFFVVHAGVDPYCRERTTRKTALVVRYWPKNSERKEFDEDHDLEQNEDPFWWELYQGDKLIIYGHDARRKLQDHRPFTLGLDSGCVYGGKLTGYLLEEKELIQVQAKRNYVRIK
jgi:diadenosine tetraphosphatase ApaH/serine/threonine PP2A family protein phosphatase